MSSDLLPFDRKDLVLKEAIPSALYDEAGVLLLRQGYTFHADELVDAFFDRPLFTRATAPAASAESLPSGAANPFALIARAEKSLSRMLRERTLAHLVTGVPKICRVLQAACQADRDAAIASILLIRTNSYYIKHVVDTAILVEIVTSAMSIPEAERISMMAAALTMNIDMARSQDKLDAQLSSLTAEQVAAIRKHPENGFQLLKDAGVKDPIWLEAVLHHHELPDGSGYPKGLTRGRMGYGSVVVGTLDVYCALVANSGHREQMPPNEVMREMFTMRGTKYGEETPAYLVKEVGIHPPGTMVMLANGETALVLRKGRVLRSPRVCALKDEKGDRLPAPTPRDTELPEFDIVGVKTKREDEIDTEPDALWSLWRKSDLPTESTDPVDEAL